MAALPAAGGLRVVVADVLLAGRGGGRAAAAAARAQRDLPGLLLHRGSAGQAGGVVAGGVQLRGHLLLLLLLLLRARQGQDLITHRQPAREPADLLGLFQAFWQQEQVGQTPHDPAMMEQPAVGRGHRLRRRDLRTGGGLSCTQNRVIRRLQRSLTPPPGK